MRPVANGYERWRRRWLAEGVGFEPTIRFPVYTLSRRAPSTTRPPLRSFSRHLRFRIFRLEPTRTKMARRANPPGRSVSHRPVAFCELALSIRGRWRKSSFSGALGERGPRAPAATMRWQQGNQARPGGAYAP